MLNLKRLSELAAFLEGPRYFNMSNWSCCIAGWTNRLFGADATRGHPMDTAAQILGLSGSQAWALFAPQTKRIRPGRKDDAGRPDADAVPWRDVSLDWAVRTIRHLAETGKVDWDACEHGPGAKPTPAQVLDAALDDVPVDDVPAEDIVRHMTATTAVLTSATWRAELRRVVPPSFAVPLEWL